MDTTELIDERIDAANAEEEFYRKRLGENWHRRFGQRRDDASRLAVYGSALVLGAGGIVVALSARWPQTFPHGTMIAAIVAMVAGIAILQGLNKHFLALERSAFAEIDGRRHARSHSPFYPLAKLAMARRVRFKDAWVEKRMADFLARRCERDRRADLFERGRVKLGSIHGTTEHRVEV